MTIAQTRSRTALVVVDAQHDVVDGHFLRDQVVANIAALADKAREAGAPVVWVRHHDEGMPIGSPEWEYVPELTMLESEPKVDKAYGDSFEDTNLESILEGLDVGKVLIVGGQTDACVRSTLHGAFVRGYDTTLVADAHTGPDRSEYGGPEAEQIIAHTNLYWKYQSAPGRNAAVVDTADVSFA